MSAPATLAHTGVASKPASQPAPSRWGRRIDVLLVGLVLLFGFVAASFLARNSDVWLHLATGRALVQGHYEFGHDPFSYTTTDLYWANHAWLFDMGLYLTYQWMGDAFVVGMKAVGVAAIASLLLILARGSGPLWVPLGCVLLAVLAMTPRLLLQPTLASVLLLAAVLCCLRVGRRWLILVPILVALWVNLDSWFLLGPIVVVLYWAGSKLEPLSVPVWPQWLIPATFLATLASPHHIHALTLPTELSPAVWSSGLADDPRFSGLFVSPWHLSTLGARGGYNLAAWAYLILLTLGGLSFLVQPRALLSWRGLVLLPFAALAGWQARLIPFFAVVAGPITALNIQDRMARQTLVQTGRLAIGLASSALIALGSFGWLVGFNNRERGIAWGIVSDPTLARAAQGIQEWRDANQIPSDTRTFPTHPDLAHYIAWFAPNERGFLDSRFTLFTTVANDYENLSRALGLRPDENSDQQQFGELLEKYHIGAVILHDPDPKRMTGALSVSVSRQPRLWQLVRVDGNAVLLMPEGASNTIKLFNPDRIVFGPPDPADIPAATTGPVALAEPTPWWLQKPHRGRKGSWEADSATVFLRLFEIGQSDGVAQSSALPLLAVRAARKGVEIDPADATAWLMIGRAYQGLAERSWEREAGDQLTLLQNLRQIQITTALVQSALQNPDSLATHDALVSIFTRRQAYDLAHQHAARALSLIQRSGPSREETLEQFAQRVARVSDFVRQLEETVQDAENRFLIRTTGMTGEPLNRAKIAADLGLYQKAVDILQISHPDLYGIEGLALLGELLIQSGRAAEARVLLDRPELKENPNALGVATIPGKPHPNGHHWSYRVPAVLWFELCVSASAGHYPAAFQAINRMQAWLQTLENNQEPELRLQFLRILGLEIGQGQPVGRTWAWLDTAIKRSHWGDLLSHVKFLAIARADLQTLAGVLELERGDAANAGRRFILAERLYEANRTLAPSLPGAPLTARYLQQLRQYNSIP